MKKIPTIIKKRLPIILTAAIISIAAATIKLSASASSDIEINSSGSLSFEGGDVLFDAADIEDMKTQVKALYDDLPNGAYAFSKEGTLKNAIKSKGIINYDSGKVIFDASDLINLADAIDSLDTSYKAEVIESLKSIHTYFTSDGAVVHVEAEAASSDNALNLTFGQICNGILKSQSLGHLSGEGILPASADNLSEGSAAWVDGDIVIGTGNDNKASYEQGYEEGYGDGEAAALGAKCYNLGNTTTIEDGRCFCDVKRMVPEVDYTKLTEDNFIICPYMINEGSDTSTTHASVPETVIPYCTIPQQELNIDGLYYNSEYGYLMFSPTTLYAFGGLNNSGASFFRQARAVIGYNVYLYTGNIIRP